MADGELLALAASLAGLLGAALAQVVHYLLGKRKLQHERNKLMAAEDRRGRREIAEVRIAELASGDKVREQLHTWMSEYRDLYEAALRETARLREEVAVLREQHGTLTRRVGHLERENQRLRLRVDELRQQLIIDYGRRPESIPAAGPEDAGKV